MIFRMTQRHICSLGGALLRLGLGAALSFLGSCASAPRAGDASIAQAAQQAPADAPRAKLSSAEAAHIEQLVANLDLDSDPLHMDITPAVLELSSLGFEIIPYLQTPLLSADEMTRLHAQRALELMLSRRLGFVAGQGWTRPEGEQMLRALWARNGSYDWQEAAAARKRSVALWMQWFGAQSAAPPPGLS